MYINKNLVNIFSLLLIVVLLVFGQTIPYDWHIFDDSFHILNNYQINNFSFKGFLYFWTNASSKIPITYNTWQLIVALFGTADPAPFRLVNIFFHFLNGVLLYYFLQKLSILLSEEKSFDKIYIPALMGTLFFLVHPVQVETVVWISSLKGILSTFFSLISLCFYLKTIEKPKEILKYVVLMTISLFLAVLSKPSAVVLPLIFIFLDIYLYKVSIKVSLIKNSHLIFIGGIFTILQVAEYATDRARVTFPFYKKAILVPSTFTKYLHLTFFPTNLDFNYGYNYKWVDEILKSDHLSLRIHLFVALAFFWLIILLTFIKKGKFKKIAFSLIFFSLAVSVNTGIVYYDFLKISAVADRYLYFPIIGISLFFTFLYEYLSPLIRKYYLPILSAALVVLCFLTFKQSQNWRRIDLSKTKSLENYENLDAVKAESYLADLINQKEIRKAFEVFVYYQTILPQKGEAYANELLNLFAEFNMNEEGEALLKIAKTNLFTLESENVLSFYLNTSQFFKALGYLESSKDNMTILDYKRRKENIYSKWFDKKLVNIKAYSMILKRYASYKTAFDFFEEEEEFTENIKSKEKIDEFHFLRLKTLEAIKIRTEFKSKLLNQKKVKEVNKLLNSKKN